MTGKKILLIALVLNLMFLGAYLSLSPLSAAEEKQPQNPAPARKEQPQDPKLQWDSLRQREEALQARQAELDALEKRIDEKIRQLGELEASIRTQLSTFRQLGDERIKHLVKIYSSMKPNAAANLMNQTDTDVAVEIFRNMKGEIAGGILSYMDTQKAAVISKRLMSARAIRPPAAQQATP